MSMMQHSGYQCPREIFGLIGRNPSVSMTNGLHVDIFQFFFILFEVYPVDSFKTIDTLNMTFSV